MHRTFVINGKRVEVDVFALTYTSNLMPITPIGGAWLEQAPTGQAMLYLAGLSTNGDRIDDSFTILDRLGDGTLVLASEPYLIAIS